MNGQHVRLFFFHDAVINPLGRFNFNFTDAARVSARKNFVAANQAIGPGLAHLAAIGFCVSTHVFDSCSLEPV